MAETYNLNISFSSLSDVAVMLMLGSFYSGSTVLLSWVAGSLIQPAIKRASAIALINVVCNTLNSKSVPQLPR